MTTHWSELPEGGYVATAPRDLTPEELARARALRPGVYRDPDAPDEAQEPGEGR